MILNRMHQPGNAKGCFVLTELKTVEQFYLDFFFFNVWIEFYFQTDSKGLKKIKPARNSEETRNSIIICFPVR